LGHKNQANLSLNWQSANPASTLLPLNANSQNGSTPSGVLLGAMASTNTIYSNILDVSRMDGIGAAITYTGTPTGTISVLGANADANFYPITFNPVITQPSGSAGGYLIDLSFWKWKYILFEYVNSSGTGTLLITLQIKDVN
jgi:hypothetical protein